VPEKGHAELLISLLWWQQEVLASPARFKAVVGGRRAGKTRLGLIFDITELLDREEGSEAWFLGPTYRQVKMIGWRDVLELIRLAPWLLEGKPNVNELTIPIVGRRQLSFKGCDQPDSLRGPGLVAFNFDEYAFVRNRLIWEKIVRPMIADKKGKGMFQTTPSGREHFCELFELGKSGDNPDWESFEIWTKDAGTVDDDELADIKATTPADFYAQEHECKFLSYEGLAVPEFSPKNWPEGNILPMEMFEKMRKHCTVWGAIDWAKSTGKTAYLEAFIDPEGRVIFTDELSMPGGAPSLVWEKISALNPAEMVVIGHDAYAKESEGFSVAEQLQRASRDDRGSIRLRLVKHYARKADAVSFLKQQCLPGFDSEGNARLPKVMVLEGRCRVYVSQMCKLSHADLEKQGHASQGIRDSFDAGLYLVMRHVKAPAVVSQESDVGRTIKPRDTSDEFESVSGLPMDE